MDNKGRPACLINSIAERQHKEEARGKNKFLFTSRPLCRNLGDGQER